MRETVQPTRISVSIRSSFHPPPPLCGQLVVASKAWHTIIIMFVYRTRNLLFVTIVPCIALCPTKSPSYKEHTPLFSFARCGDDRVCVCPPNPPLSVAYYA